jgi:hypothetical protein
MNKFLPSLISSLHWTLRKAVFLIPLALLVAWVSNPHGPFGGYFFLLGLIVLFPMHFLHSYIGPLNSIAIWMLAIALQLAYLAFMFMCGRWVFVRLKNMRDKKSHDLE